MDLMRSLQASRWQIFSKLEVPAALPVLFGGLKVGATLSVIGAVIGEFVGADRGLGFLINLARGLLDTPLLDGERADRRAREVGPSDLLLRLEGFEAAFNL